MVEKERKKDLGKVVTGGGEGTGKSKPQRTRRRQTTEGTEDTEMGREGADTLVRSYINGRWRGADILVHAHIIGRWRGADTLAGSGLGLW